MAMTDSLTAAKYSTAAVGFRASSSAFTLYRTLSPGPYVERSAVNDKLSILSALAIQ